MLQIFLVLLIAFILFVIIESTIEIRKLNITTYDIENSKIPKQFNGYKLILMSDLHNCFYNNEKILQTIKDQKPNGVVIAGDMMVYGDIDNVNNFKSLDLIKEISKYSDVYFAPGNHEMGYMTRKNSEWLKFEKYLLDTDSDNIYFLDNKKIELCLGNSKINIYGLHLTDGYYKRFIKKPLDNQKLLSLMGEINKQDYNILIAHNPDYFDIYSAWGADIVLSGHNHGGLMKLPILGGVISPRLRLFPKYDYGIHKIKDSTLILSSGLGAHSLKIRVNNKPELVIINFSN